MVKMGGVLALNWPIIIQLASVNFDTVPLVIHFHYLLTLCSLTLSTQSITKYRGEIR